MNNTQLHIYIISHFTYYKHTIPRSAYLLVQLKSYLNALCVKMILSLLPWNLVATASVLVSYEALRNNLKNFLSVFSMWKKNENVLHVQDRNKSKGRSFRQANLDKIKIKMPLNYFYFIEEDADDEKTLCKICIERKLQVVFEACGHMSCRPCATKMKECPFCRTPLSKLITIYNWNTFQCTLLYNTIVFCMHLYSFDQCFLM